MYYNKCFCDFSLQPARRIVYVVPKSIQINTLHHLAQLQMENFKGHNRAGDIPHVDTVFLLHSWLLGQENVRSLVFVPHKITRMK